MTIAWNPEKNAALKTRYGFGSQRILMALSGGALATASGGAFQSPFPNAVWPD